MFSRVCSQQEAEQHKFYTLDATLNTLSTDKLAGLYPHHRAVVGQPEVFVPKLIEHLTSSSLVIVEEAQQAADMKTAFSISLLYNRQSSEA